MNIGGIGDWLSDGFPSTLTTTGLWVDVSKFEMKFAAGPKHLMKPSPFIVFNTVYKANNGYNCSYWFSDDRNSAVLPDP
jgi:hypothetical protein